VRAVGGRVLLRIEDHDRRRSRTSYERAILDDLDWLGFIPDEPATDTFRAGPCAWRQSDRYDLCESALARLRAEGLVYACECSRTEIIAAGGSGRELRYPGTCARKHLRERPGLGTRIRLAPAVERFDELSGS
jgi:glutamyl-Q tRNA(Asp) synthetase